MIQSKKDLEFYLAADRIALGIQHPSTLSQKLKFHFAEDIFKFERLLRKTEYRLNCDKSLFGKFRVAYLCYRLTRKGLKLGFEISPNCFGAGLGIAHLGTIVVHHKTRIGSNCRIHPCVVIGTQAGYSDRCPTIGNNVFIGPGAKIFGEITIADGIAIGANSVVNKSFLEPNITIAGIPARKVSNKGSKGLLADATEVLHVNP